MNKIIQVIEKSEKEELVSYSWLYRNLCDYKNLRKEINFDHRASLRQSQINLIEEIIKLSDRCESEADMDEWKGLKCLRDTLRDSIKEIKSYKKQ